MASNTAETNFNDLVTAQSKSLTANVEVPNGNIVDHTYHTRVDASERFLYNGIYYAQHKVVYEAFNDLWKTDTAARSYEPENHDVSCNAVNVNVEALETLEKTEFMQRDRTADNYENRDALQDTFKGIRFLETPVAEPGRDFETPTFCSDLCKKTSRIHRANLWVAFIGLVICIGITMNARKPDETDKNDDLTCWGKNRETIFRILVALTVVACLTFSSMHFSETEGIANCLLEDVDSYMVKDRPLFVKSIDPTTQKHLGIPIAITTFFGISLILHFILICVSWENPNSLYTTASELFIESGF